MHRYAQTYLQLHHQLWEMGYSDKEIQNIQNAYKLAMQVFTGYFQANGKDFFAHLVGTASILASVKASPNIVAAGLLHNIYGRGDFGDGQTGITPSRQERVTHGVGNEIEGLLYTFHTMGWNPNLFSSILDQLPHYSETKQTVVLLHLADALEHKLDYGTVYYGESQRIWRTTHADILADMAEILGMPSLAKEIRHMDHLNSTYEVSSRFRSPEEITKGSFLAPKSCSKWFTVTMREWWRKWRRGFQWALSGFTRRTRMTIKTIQQRFTTS